MATRTLLLTKNPYQYSNNHRMKFIYDGKLTTAFICPRVNGDATVGRPKERVYFRQESDRFASDELPVVSHLYYTKNTLDPAVGPIQTGLREIYGKIITTEVGNGRDDFMMDRILIEVTQDGTPNYDYQAVSAAKRTPLMNIYYRNETFLNENPAGVDLIKSNYDAYPQSGDALESIRQRPQNVSRESITLVSPMTGFRRMRAEYSVLAWSEVIRGLQIIVTRWNRRPYG